MVPVQPQRTRPEIRWDRAIWTRRGQGSAAERALRAPLWIASGPYAATMIGRAFAYRRGWLRSVRVDARVIVVGNLSVGGTGKTPVAAWIAGALRDRGLRPAVVLRGYHGRVGPGPVVVSEGNGPLVGPETAGDEAVLLARRLTGVPVVCHPVRAAAAELAVARFQADHIVLDDGYQHLGLIRDLDVLVADARDNPAEHYLLPRGPLREPLAAAARAGAVVISGSRDHTRPDWDWLERFCPGASVFPMRYRISGTWRLGREGEGAPADAPALAFCGIGSPENFFGGLAEAGIQVVATMSFPDHHRYRPGDLAGLAERARRSGALRLVTTAKDAVKIDPAWTGGLAVDVVGIEPDFFGAEDRLMEIVLGDGLEKGW